MQSRRDLFQAHRLMTQRAARALLRGEPDIPDQPLRRLNVAAFSGVLVAVIVAALFGIWGLLGHGDSQLQPKPGTLVIDKQTGTAYVFCQGGKLCPVLNYASARLALQSASVDQQTVSQASLTKFARGPLIGIPGLPQPLPDPGLLLRQPWSVCVQTVLGLSGDRTSTTLVGGIGTGGHSLAGGALGLTIFGPWIVKLVFKDSFVAVAAQVLPWYAWAMVPLSAGGSDGGLSWVCGEESGCDVDMTRLGGE